MKNRQSEICFFQTLSLFGCTKGFEGESVTIVQTRCDDFRYFWAKKKSNLHQIIVFFFCKNNKNA